MNQSQRLILFLGLGCAVLAPDLRAQEAAADEGDDKRVQYQLVRPDEKTPENVKPEEHNPFESESEALDRQAPGDTEENRVRDRLLRLPVVGTKRMPDGRMRVLLGNIILETGKTVPPVLPEQLVELKVKNITTEYIELAWQEKRATGLPPKLMVIPINISPRVRYQMLGQSAEEATKGANATLEMPLRGLIAEPAPQPSSVGTPPPPRKAQPLNPEVVLDDPPPPATQAQESVEPPPTAVAQSDMTSPPQPSSVPVAPPTVQPAPAAQTTLVPQPTPELSKTTPEEDAPPPAGGQPPPPMSPAVESVVRMLFATPAPAPK